MVAVLVLYCWQMPCAEAGACPSRDSEWACFGVSTRRSVFRRKWSPSGLSDENLFLLVAKWTAVPRETPWLWHPGTPFSLLASVSCLHVGLALPLSGLLGGSNVSGCETWYTSPQGFQKAAPLGALGFWGFQGCPHFSILQSHSWGCRCGGTEPGVKLDPP